MLLHLVIFLSGPSQTPLQKTSYFTTLSVFQFTKLGLD
jgi:hypothetical protein